MRRNEYRVPRPADDAVHWLAPHHRHELLANLIFAMPSKEFRRYGAKTVWWLRLCHAPREFANQRRFACAIGSGRVRGISAADATGAAAGRVSVTLLEEACGALGFRILATAGSVPGGGGCSGAARSSLAPGGRDAGTAVCTAPTPAASTAPAAVRPEGRVVSVRVTLARRRTATRLGGGGAGFRASGPVPGGVSAGRPRRVARSGIKRGLPARTPTPPAW